MLVTKIELRLMITVMRPMMRPVDSICALCARATAITACSNSDRVSSTPA